MRTVIALMVFVALVPCTTLAQDPHTSLREGAKVRISAPSLGDGPRTARIVASTGDTLVVRPAGARDFTVAIPRAEITRIEVPTGHRPRKGRFALIGLVGGTVIGGIVGAASYSDPCAKDPTVCAGWFYETKQGDAVSGALGGAVLGALGGALLGQLWQRETWSALPLTRTVRVRIAPDRGRVASREGSGLDGVRVTLRWLQ